MSACPHAYFNFSSLPSLFLLPSPSGHNTTGPAEPVLTSVRFPPLYSHFPHQALLLQVRQQKRMMHAMAPVPQPLISISKMLHNGVVGL